MAKKNSRFGMFVFVTLLLVLAVLMTSFVYFSPQAVNAMGCSKDKDYENAHTAILLDSTEPYGINQVKHVAKHIYRTIEQLRPMDRISIFQVKTNLPSKIELIFERCVPGENNQDAPIMQALKEARFSEEIETALLGLQGSQKSSPIINALSGVAATFDQEKSPKTILLVSDLIEHSEIMSMYSDTWLAAVSKESDRLDKTRPMLDGIEIHIVFMHRPDQRQQNFELRDWWLEYLDRSGANVTRVKNIFAG